MFTDSSGGTKYPLKRVKIEELKENGFLDVLILHPAKHLNRVVLSPQPNDMRVMYEIIIATNNPRAVETAVHKFMTDRSQAEFDRYSVTTSPSRFKERSLCAMYPSSVRVALKVGVPFDYQEILSLIPKSEYGLHFLSTPYNNGMFPVTNVWFEIPEKYQDYRMKQIHEIVSVPQTKYGQPHIEKIRALDTTLLHTLLDAKEDFVKHIGAVFLDHTSSDVDAIDRRYSVCINGVNTLHRENPIIPRMRVEGIDCVSLADSAKYAELVDMQKYVNPDIHIPRLLGSSSHPSQPSRGHTPYITKPPYIMASRIAKYSGRFTFYQTPLDEFLMGLQTNRKNWYSVSELEYLCETLLVQKIRIYYDAPNKAVGESN